MANPDRSVYDPPFDDDLMIDTIDEPETTRGRPLMILLGIVVVLAFAGVIWVAYRQGVDHASRNEPPLLATEPGPARVAPTETQTAAVPDNPIYEQLDGATAAATPAPETLAPPAEEPAALPPAPTAAEQPVTAEPTPDMTVAEIPPAGPSVRPKSPGTIPSEITAEPQAPSSSVDPLPPGASLPPAPEITAPAIEAPIVPASPTPAEIAAAAKIEKDRIAREAAAAKKVEAARLAEIKRQQQLAAVKPPPAPIEAPVAVAAPENPPPSVGPRTDASGRPTLIMPPAFDGTLPAPTAPAAAEAPPARVAAVPSAARSEVVPDETPAPAAPASGGGDFVVQIGAYNSAEDAGATGKRISNSFSSALGGASLEIRQTEIKGATKYRLRATGYADRAAATSACNRLKAAGQQCFVAAR